MPSLSGRKAQFFILTTVVIVGVFYTLSKYINPHVFVDTSRTGLAGEVFFFDNVKNKAIDTVQISNPLQLKSNLDEYKNFIGRMAGEKKYNLAFNYTIGNDAVNMSIILMSQKYTLKSNFTVQRPP
jgi:hypothetical protein